MARVSKDLTAAAERADRRDRAAQRFERNIHTSLAGRLGREIVERDLSGGFAPAKRRRYVRAFFGLPHRAEGSL